MILPAQLLELAVAVAREAGRMLIEKRPADGPDVVQTKTSPTDVVTQMDRAAETLIVDRIRAVRPDDAFLGEEGGSSGSGGSGVTWVIDPIDGTVNYLYDLPDWGVSVAAEIGGQTVAGVVDIPRRAETYTATRGGGALLHTAADTRALRCTAQVPLERALVATGFGYDRARRARQAEVLTGVLPNVRDIRRGGACSVDLCSLAAGRVDGYYERGVQVWDLAAGALIVREAGGRVEGLDGAPAGRDLAIAAGPGTFEALHGLLRPLDPARD